MVATRQPAVLRGAAAAVQHASITPVEALEIVDRLREEPALDTYHLLASVRGDLLDKLGRPEKARDKFERTAQRTPNVRQRAALLERAAACASRT